MEPSLSRFRDDQYGAMLALCDYNYYHWLENNTLEGDTIACPAKKLNGTEQAFSNIVSSLKLFSEDIRRQPESLEYGKWIVAAGSRSHYCSFWELVRPADLHVHRESTSSMPSLPIRICISILLLWTTYF